MYRVLFLFVGLMHTGMGLLQAQDRSEEDSREGVELSLDFLDSLERADHVLRKSDDYVSFRQDEGRGSFAAIVLQGFSFEFGFDFLQEAPSDLRNRWWQSGAYQFNWQYTDRLRDSKFYLSYGAYIGAYRFELRERFILDRAEGRTRIGEVEDLVGRDIEDVESNRFAFTYIGIPVELCYYGSNERERGFMLRLGAYIGLMTDERVIVRYEQDGLDKKLKVEGNKDFQVFRYGLQGSIGYSGLALFYRYHLSPIFKDGKGPEGSDDTRYSTVGLRLGL